MYYTRLQTLFTLVQFDILRIKIDSIVVFSQIEVGATVRTVLKNFFAACGERPVMNIVGDIHPYTYCSTPTDTDNVDILKVTVEAFKAAPLKMSIVMDPDTGKHYFHMECAYNCNEATGKCNRCSAVTQGKNQNIVCQRCC